MSSQSPKRGPVKTVIGKRLENLKAIHDRMTPKTGNPEPAPGITTPVRKQKVNLGPEVYLKGIKKK